MLATMLLRVHGALFFEVIKGDALAVRYRACGGHVTVSLAAQALMVHDSGCEVLALVRDIAAMKPFSCRVSGSGGRKTELFHEAQARLC